MHILLPICYLPPIEYFRLIVNADSVCLEQHEHLVKQSWRSRCEIYGANGKLKLVVPVQHTGERIPVREVRIDNTQRWQKLHWRSLESAYRSSPFFEYYEDDLRPFYENPYEKLSDLNLALMKHLLAELGIEKELTYTAEYEANPEAQDYRWLHPKQPATNNQQPATNSYIQVFGDKHGFLPNLSIVDLLFNEGQHAKDHLRSP